jgi:Zn-dependent peptidase ImmA (M78 family)/transcriptional regulator with XRE-family HTH domain
MPANGVMLRLARQRKGFQQTEAAARLGLEQPLLSRIENGLAEPHEEVLLRAEAAYEMPRSFFELTDPVYGAPVSVHPMWRRKADVSVREMDAVIAELNIRIIHLRRLLEGAELAHSNDLPRLDVEDYGDPEKVAAILRAHWKVPRGPIRDLTLLVERAGVLVAHSALGGASISGVTFAAPGVPPLVVLNSDQPADRLRYTLAHELGHLVMHRFPSPNMEVEANEFASALLMPASDIKPYFVGRRIDLALLASLKPEWRVAMQALLMRATSLDLITKNQAQYLWKQINARRLRLREPPELDFEPERPTVIETMIRLHKEALGYTSAELARMLHSRERDLSKFYTVATIDKRPRFSILK